MRKLFQTAFNIRPQELSLTLCLFGYLFLLICSLLLIKPVSYSLLIKHIGIEKLPLAFMWIAFCSIFFIKGYSWVLNRIGLKKTMYSHLIFSVSFLLFAWLLFSYEDKSLSHYYGFYVWTSIFGIVSASQFWLLGNRLFTTRQAK